MYEIADRLLTAASDGRALVVATAIAIDGSAPRTVGTSMAFDGVAVIGSIAGGCVEGAVVEIAARVLATGRAETVDFGIDDDMAMSVGLTCGGALRVHVQPFTTAEVIVEWPTDYLARAAIDEHTVICVLSHDWRFDAEVLAIALRSPAAYVGAMGSRVTDARRRASLDELGVDHSRLHSPIGLDLGASTPPETAVSILAEVLAQRSRASAGGLTHRTGAIHTRGLAAR